MRNLYLAQSIIFSSPSQVTSDTPILFESLPNVRATFGGVYRLVWPSGVFGECCHYLKIVRVQVYSQEKHTVAVIEKLVVRKMATRLEH